MKVSKANVVLSPFNAMNRVLLMSQTITIRLTKELAEWLDAAAELAGVSPDKLAREQLDQARRQQTERPFLRLAGSVRGPKGLSRRKGFSRG